MRTPNPLPCGCGAKGTRVIDVLGEQDSWVDVHVHHCPLHAAAADLLAALKDCADSEPCRYDHNDLCQEHYSRRPCRNEVARAAIAKAEPPTEKGE